MTYQVRYEFTWEKGSLIFKKIDSDEVIPPIERLIDARRSVYSHTRNYRYCLPSFTGFCRPSEGVA